jgi:hypothetical protein
MKHRRQAENARNQRRTGDPHIVVIESEPTPERECWRLWSHWHCHQDDD